MKKEELKKSLFPDLGDVDKLLSSEMKEIKGGTILDECKSCSQSCKKQCSPGNSITPR